MVPLDLVCPDCSRLIKCAVKLECCRKTVCRGCFVMKLLDQGEVCCGKICRLEDIKPDFEMREKIAIYENSVKMNTAVVGSFLAVANTSEEATKVHTEGLELGLNPSVAVLEPELLPPGKELELLPPGGEPELLPPGGELELLPLGGELELLPPCVELELLPPGGEPELLPPGGELELLPPGGELELLPPGGEPELLPPGGEQELLPPDGELELLPPGGEPELLPSDGELELLPPDGELELLPPGKEPELKPKEEPELLPPRKEPESLSTREEPELLPLGEEPKLLPPCKELELLLPREIPKLWPPGEEPELFPPGKEPELLPPEEEPGLFPLGEEPGLFPPGEEPQLLPPWEEPELLPSGEEPELLLPGEEPGLFPPGEELGLFPPGEEPELFPPGKEPELFPTSEEPELLQDYPVLKTPRQPVIAEESEVTNTYKYSDLCSNFVITGRWNSVEDSSYSVVQENENGRKFQTLVILKGLETVEQSAHSPFTNLGQRFGSDQWTEPSYLETEHSEAESNNLSFRSWRVVDNRKNLKNELNKPEPKLPCPPPKVVNHVIKIKIEDDNRKEPEMSSFPLTFSKYKVRNLSSSKDLIQDPFCNRFGPKIVGEEHLSFKSTRDHSEIGNQKLTLEQRLGPKLVEQENCLPLDLPQNAQTSIIKRLKNMRDHVEIEENDRKLALEERRINTSVTATSCKGGSSSCGRKRRRDRRCSGSEDEGILSFGDPNARSSSRTKTKRSNWKHKRSPSQPRKGNFSKTKENRQKIFYRKRSLDNWGERDRLVVPRRERERSIVHSREREQSFWRDKSTGFGRESFVELRLQRFNGSRQEQSIGSGREQSINFWRERSISSRREKSMDPRREKSIGPRRETSNGSRRERSVVFRLERSHERSQRQKRRFSNEKLKEPDLRDFIGQSKHRRSSSGWEERSPQPRRGSTTPVWTTRDNLESLEVLNPQVDESPEKDDEPEFVDADLVERSTRVWSRSNSSHQSSGSQLNVWGSQAVPVRCEVCSLTVTCQATYQTHVNGKPHKKRLVQMEKLKKEEEKREAARLSQVELAKKKAEMALEGKSIKELPAVVTQQPPEKPLPEKDEDFLEIQPNGDLLCTLCKARMNSRDCANSHLNGKAHKKTLTMAQKRGGMQGRGAMRGGLSARGGRQSAMPEPPPIDRKKIEELNADARAEYDRVFAEAMSANVDLPTAEKKALDAMNAVLNGSIDASKDESEDDDLWPPRGISVLVEPKGFKPGSYRCEYCKVNLPSEPILEAHLISPGHLEAKAAPENADAPSRTVYYGKRSGGNFLKAQRGRRGLISNGELMPISLTKGERREQRDIAASIQKHLARQTGEHKVLPLLMSFVRGETIQPE